MNLSKSINSICLSDDLASVFACELKLDAHAFSSFPIAVVRSVDHLAFGTEKDAIDAMEVAAGVRKISNTNCSIDAKKINPTPSGEPFMGGSHQKNKKVNECLSVNLNLVTGKCLVSQGPCWIE